jgi:hypothetical protein
MHIFSDPFDYSSLAFGGGPAIASSMQNDNYQMRSAAIHNPSMQHQQYNREMVGKFYGLTSIKLALKLH